MIIKILYKRTQNGQNFHFAFYIVSLVFLTKSFGEKLRTTLVTDVCESFSYYLIFTLKLTLMDLN